MKTNLPTSIPAHYRRLGENESYHRGDLYVDPNGIIGRCLMENDEVKNWPGFKFYHRQHVATNPLRAAKQNVIAHWTRLATGTTIGEENTGSEDCAFCQLSHARNGCRYDCTGCPIKEKTGRYFCSGSPYVSSLWSDKNSPKFQAKAKIFLEWLKNLPV